MKSIGREWMYLNRTLHCTKGPAVEYPDGRKEYWVNGKSISEVDFERKFGKSEDKEVNLILSSQKEWRNYKGQLHRLDGPAVEWSDGSKFYYVKGKYHRIDGPAVDKADGSKEYWLNGQRHRSNGPAVESPDGKKEYWVNGKSISEVDFEMTYNKREYEESTPFLNKMKEQKEWRNYKGQLHRLDGPAIERADGSKFYYVNGKRHRIDGPALEYADGSKYYFVNDKRHRIDGPAVEDADGSKYYYVNDKSHRLYGPAIERGNGTKEYYVNGEKHRIDGPAVEYADGRIEYWIDGFWCPEKKFRKIQKRALGFQSEVSYFFVEETKTVRKDDIEKEAKKLSEELSTMPLSKSFDLWNKYRQEKAIEKIEVIKLSSLIKDCFDIFYIKEKGRVFINQEIVSPRAIAVLEWHNNLDSTARQIFDLYLEAITAKASPTVLKFIEEKYLKEMNIFEEEKIVDKKQHSYSKLKSLTDDYFFSKIKAIKENLLTI